MKNGTVRLVRLLLIVTLPLLGCCTSSSTVVSTIGDSDASSNPHRDVGPTDSGGQDAGPDAVADTSDTSDAVETADAVDVAPDTSTGETGTAAVVYCLQAARVLCDRLYDCTTEAAALRDKLEQEFGFEDAYGCREKLTHGLAGICQPAALSAQKGRSTYQPAAADDCLSQMQSTSCDIVFSGLPDLSTNAVFQPTFCDDIVVAKQQGLETCLSDSDCVESAPFCQGVSVQSGVTGTCAARGQQGEDCSAIGSCADGLFCDSSGTCAALPRQGDDCTSVCQSGLICNRQTDTCAPPGSPGDPCYEAADCRSDLACDASNVCATAPSQDEHCFERCQPGLRCNYGTELCEPLPGDGESCTSKCGVGLICGSDSTCKPVAGPGDSCTDAACAKGLTCRDADATCAAPATIGEACIPGGCIWYAICGDDATCQARPALGDACAQDCIEPSVCSGSFCMDPSTLESCDSGSCSASDEHCDNGLCIKG